MAAQHVVGIIGGAVAGSEAAALVAERGALAVVIEQNLRPYGKIEDGLPRWHSALRDKEYGRIDENLGRDNVLFVPGTAVGRDVGWDELTGELGLNAIILANGAWRDRHITSVEGIDRFEGKGLVYQNQFVYWFNHYHEAGYDGPRFEVSDGAVVIGGGLASIDVVKIINLELYARALRERGVEIDVVELEHKGIAETLEENGIAQGDLGLKGVTLFYRRRAEDMPLATTDDPKPTPEQRAKLEKVRLKILDKVLRKYLVNFEGQTVATGYHEENGRLVGLEFHRTALEGRDVTIVPGSAFTVHTDLVVSSIGSIPEPIPGVAMRGELYGFASWDTGELDRSRGVFGLGNVLTGKGNIKDSRKNARDITGRILDHELGLSGAGATSEAVHAEARGEAEAVVAEALARPALDEAAVERVRAWVRRRWEAVGYGGDYAAWMDRHRPG